MYPSFAGEQRKCKRVIALCRAVVRMQPPKCLASCNVIQVLSILEISMSFKLPFNFSSPNTALCQWHIHFQLPFSNLSTACTLCPTEIGTWETPNRLMTIFTRKNLIHNAALEDCWTELKSSIIHAIAQ